MVMKICKLNNEEIIDLYLNKKKSCKEIANLFGMKSDTNISNHLKKLGINIRSSNEGKKIWYASNPNKNWNKGKKGLQVAWNKGLTKEDSRIAKYGKAIGLARKGKTWEDLYGKENAIRMKERYKNKLLSNPIHRFNKEVINKLRIARLGKKSPEQSIRMRLNNPMKRIDLREKASERNSGEKNYFWNGGLSLEPYSPEFNKLFKEAIRIRDNDSCVICGSDKSICIHHIDYNKLNTTKENCISLCRNCHTKTNFNRGHWIKFFQSMMNEKYGYNYNLILEMKNEQICIS
jgi:hypothetical protein